MRKTIFYILTFFVFNATADGQEYTPIEIIKKSINYHDPDGLIFSGRTEFDFRETRPNAAERFSKVVLDQNNEYYLINRVVDGREIMIKKMSGEFTFTMDGATEISKSDIEKYRLNAKRADFMINYYRYLWCAPMVLLDPGTILHDTILNKEFFGISAKEIKVTYEEGVGKDIWYFYFEPDTYRMIGYRFYYNEADNDGEYILLEGEAKFGSVRLPKSRKWYTHKEAKFLGTDHLTTFRIE